MSSTQSFHGPCLQSAAYSLTCRFFFGGGGHSLWQLPGYSLLLVNGGVDHLPPAPGDYMTLPPTEWTFSSGVNRVCVDITIQPDGVNEVTAETFSVNLTSTDDAVVLGRSVTTVTIGMCQS